MESVVTEPGREREPEPEPGPELEREPDERDVASSLVAAVAAARAVQALPLQRSKAN